VIGTGENNTEILQVQQVLLLRSMPRKHRNSCKTKSRAGEKLLRWRFLRVFILHKGPPERRLHVKRRLNTKGLYSPVKRSIT